jgi:hypothetical protein
VETRLEDLAHEAYETRVRERLSRREAVRLKEEQTLRDLIKGVLRLDLDPHGRLAKTGHFGFSYLIKDAAPVLYGWFRCERCGSRGEWLPITCLGDLGHVEDIYRKHLCRPWARRTW